MAGAGGDYYNPGAAACHRADEQHEGSLHPFSFLCTAVHLQAHCTMHIERASWLAHRLRWRCWDCQMETSHHQPRLQLQSWQTASSSCWQSTQSLQLLRPRLQVTMMQ